MHIVRISLVGLVAALAVLADSVPNAPGLGLQVFSTGAAILVEEADGSLGGVNLVRSSELEEATTAMPLPVLVDGSVAALQEELGLAAELITVTASVGPTIFVGEASAVYSVHLGSSDRLERALAEVPPSILAEQASGVSSFPLIALATGVELPVARSILVEHSESATLLQLSPPTKKTSPEPSPPGEAQLPWLWIVLAGVALAVIVVVLLSRH